MEKMLMMLFIINITLFLQMSHPFFMSGFLFLNTILIVLFVYSVIDHWLNLIIVLIYLGGILVIFIYISSILPNLVSKFLLSMFMYLNLGMLYMPMMNKINLMSMKPTIFLVMLNMSWGFIMFLLLFLFFTLISSVEFSWKKSTPMRMF